MSPPGCACHRNRSSPVPRGNRTLATYDSSITVYLAHACFPIKLCSSISNKSYYTGTAVDSINLSVVSQEEESATVTRLRDSTPPRIVERSTVL